MTDLPEAASAKRRFSNALLKLGSKLTALLLLVGYFGVAWLPFVDRSNFFDENALLTGSASSTIRWVNHAPLDHVLHLLEQERVHEKLPSWLPLLLDNLPASVDLTTYSYTQEQDGVPVQCHNFHAVLRAPTTDGTDAILLVTPVAYGASSTGSFNQTQEAANVAVVLGAAMMTHLSTVKWLARDVIWLVPDGRCGLLPSVQNWVDNYRLQSAGWAALNFQRGGLIRQALVLEVTDHRFNAVELSVEGFDGRLPNLDMYWLVTSLATSSLPLTIRLQTKPELYRWVARQQLSWDVRRHVEKSLTVLEFLWRQAKGMPTGAHAPLLSAGVDAVTLRLVQDPGSRRGDVTVQQRRNVLAQLLDVTELTVRSCNNLLESLHHSYKLYLQSGRDTFISIDMYIIPFAALFLVLVVRMILLHLHLSRGPTPPPLSLWLTAMKRLATLHAFFTIMGLLALAAPPPHITSFTTLLTYIAPGSTTTAARYASPHGAGGVNHSAGGVDRQRGVNHSAGGVDRQRGVNHSTNHSTAGVDHLAPSGDVNRLASTEGPLGSTVHGRSGGVNRMRSSGSSSLAKWVDPMMRRVLEGVGVAGEGSPVGGQQESEGVEWWVRFVCGGVLVGGALLVEFAWALGGSGKEAEAKQEESSVASNGQQPIRADWRCSKVLVLASTAMGAGAIACINWSLAMVVAGLLIPLVLGITPLWRQNSGQASPRLMPSRLLGLFFLALLSSPLPVVMLDKVLGSSSAISVSSGSGLMGNLASSMDWSLLTYMVTWSLYAPIWFVSIWLPFFSVDYGKGSDPVALK